MWLEIFDDVYALLALNSGMWVCTLILKVFSYVLMCLVPCLLAWWVLFEVCECVNI